MSSALSRRRMLQGLGVGALAYALPLGRSGRAMAAPPIPKRLVVFYGGGMIDSARALSKVRGVGGAAPTETSFQLGELHAALTPHQKDLLVIEGLGMVSEEIDKGPTGNAHNQGAKHSLAAADTTIKDVPGGPSIDQYVAAQLKAKGQLTALDSLVLQCADWTNEAQVFSGAVAGMGKNPVAGIWDPRKAFDTVFAGFTAPGQTGPSAADVLKEQQAAIYGFAAAEFGALAKKLPKADADRLLSHQALVDDLAKKIGNIGPPPVTCAPPTKSGFAAKISDKCDFACYKPEDANVFARNWQLGTELNMALITAALACDRTRVVFVEVQNAPGGISGYTPGMMGTMDNHDLRHKVNNDKDPLAKDPTALGVIRKECEKEAEVLASLLSQLAAVKEADGQRLLDHTAVLWCGQIGYGSHNLEDLPWMVAGSCGGAIKTGRWLKLPKYAKSSRGWPHNDLFVSLANAMGIETNVFGNPACCGGPLAGVTG